MTLSPHELIKLPHGKAKKELLKAGLWDEAALIDGRTDFLFIVEVSGHYEPEIETATIEVYARSKEVAIHLATEKSNFDEITDTKIISVKEAKE